MHYEESVEPRRAPARPGAARARTSTRRHRRRAWDKLLRENAGASRGGNPRRHRPGQAPRYRRGAPAAVALGEADVRTKHRRPSAVIIRGTEGMAVQFANCCRPIPGDPIIGFINKGQGLVIHTHDCPAIAHSRNDPDKWLDVEWDPETSKLFDVSIKLVVANQRGVLAKVAADIADAGSNIDNVSMEDEDGSAYTTMYFTLQVETACTWRASCAALRRIPEVVRISA